MKLHLHEYTPDEVRGIRDKMQASWLAWQGLGRPVEEDEAGDLNVRDTDGTRLMTYDSKTFRLSMALGAFGRVDIASDPGAAMNALEELGRQATADERYWIEIYSSGDEWRVGIAPQSERHDDGDPYFVEGCAPSLPLAVAYACALWGLRNLKEKHTSISYKENTQ